MTVEYQNYHTRVTGFIRFLQKMLQSKSSIPKLACFCGDAFPPAAASHRRQPDDAPWIVLLAITQPKVL